MQVSEAIPPRPPQPRDSLASAVEERLRELAQQRGVDFLHSGDKAGVAKLAFDGIAASGETRDIAALRLASALLDHPRFQAGVTHALRHLAALAAH